MSEEQKKLAEARRICDTEGFAACVAFLYGPPSIRRAKK